MFGAEEKRNEGRLTTGRLRLLVGDCRLLLLVSLNSTPVESTVKDPVTIKTYVTSCSGMGRSCPACVVRKLLSPQRRLPSPPCRSSYDQSLTSAGCRFAARHVHGADRHPDPAAIHPAPVPSTLSVFRPHRLGAPGGPDGGSLVGSVQTIRFPSDRSGGPDGGSLHADVAGSDLRPIDPRGRERRGNTAAGRVETGLDVYEGAEGG